MSESEVPHHQHISGVSTQSHSQTIVGSFRDVYLGSANGTQEALEPAAVACRNALFLTDPDVDRESLTSAKGTRVVGTCEWITREYDYRAWLEGDTHLLWISGGPGKGKTMMSIFLTEELQKHTAGREEQNLAFVFCSAQDEKRNSAITVLRSLVYQIIYKRPQLVKHALLYFETPERTQQTLASLETLWIIFSKLVTDAELGTMFCVLDGLDECKESTLRLLLPRIVNLLAHTTKSSIKGICKLAIISRDIIGLQGCRRIRLDPDNDGQVASDIKLFVSARVQELSNIDGFNDDFRAYVQRALLRRAEGTFLWVGFAVHELSQKQTCTEIQKALKGLLRGLPAIYSRMLLRIPEEEKATSCAILRWVTMARRPLNLLELAAAVDIEASHSLISIDQAVCDAVSYCKPLLAIKDEEVQLVHQSVRDYILQTDPNATAPPGPFRITSDEAHSEIAQTCLNCIAKSSFKYRPLTLDEMHLPQESALLEYAAFRWPSHVRSCSSLGTGLLRGLEQFFETTHDVRRHWWAAYRERYYLSLPEVLPLLHMLCYFGYEPSIQKTLAWDRWKPRFLKRVDSRDCFGTTALQLMASKGNETMVRLLLNKGADIEAKDKYGDTVLHIVAYQGREVMVQLLLNKGADIEAKNEEGHTALHIAAEISIIAIVQLLLDKGADIEAKNEEGHTALHKAAYRDKNDMVQLLLDRGANIDARDGDGKTPLILAAQREHEKTGRLLADKGADINAKSNNGWTALHWAVLRKHEALTHELINKGADVKAKANNGWTVLHSAIGRKDEVLAKLLKAHSAS